MSRESSIFFLGLLVIITRFSGLPSSWKDALFFLCGIAICSLAFLLRRQRALNLFGTGEHRSDSFVQNSMRDTKPTA